MKRLFVALVLILFCTNMAFATNAGDIVAGRKVDAKEAKMVDFVKDAMKYVKANGKAAACKAFNAQKGEPNFDRFHKGELYIYGYDYNHINQALGSKPQLVGKDLSGMRSNDGKYIVRELVETAKKGNGWVEYTFEHPETKAIRPKVSYVEKVDNNWFIGSGIYK
jgi:signal transduction histidine kinase